MQNRILTRQIFVPENIFFFSNLTSEISKDYTIFLKRTNMSKISKKTQKFEIEKSLKIVIPSKEMRFSHQKVDF